MSQPNPKNESGGVAAGIGSVGAGFLERLGLTGPSGPVERDMSKTLLADFEIKGILKDAALENNRILPEAIDRSERSLVGRVVQLDQQYYQQSADPEEKQIKYIKLEIRRLQLWIARRWWAFKYGIYLGNHNRLSPSVSLVSTALAISGLPLAYEKVDRSNEYLLDFSDPGSIAESDLFRKAYVDARQQGVVQRIPLYTDMIQPFPRLKEGEGVQSFAASLMPHPFVSPAPSKEVRFNIKLTPAPPKQPQLIQSHTPISNPPPQRSSMTDPTKNVSGGVVPVSRTIVGSEGVDWYRMVPPAPSKYQIQSAFYDPRYDKYRGPVDKLHAEGIPTPPTAPTTYQMQAYAADPYLKRSYAARWRRRPYALRPAPRRPYRRRYTYSYAPRRRVYRRRTYAPRRRTYRRRRTSSCPSGMCPVRRTYRRRSQPRDRYGRFVSRY